MSKLTTGQMTDYLEQIRDFAAQRLHLVIEDPDIEWRVKAKRLSEIAA